MYEEHVRFMILAEVELAGYAGRQLQQSPEPGGRSTRYRPLATLVAYMNR